MTSIKLQETITQCISRFEQIPPGRKKVLNELSDFIESRLNGQQINLIFICVHNSRRSHFSQVWAQVAAEYYGFSNIHCYSGGTEVTELYPTVAETLKSQGLDVRKLREGKNPVYSIKSTGSSAPIVAFSKLFDDPFNPENDFGAIMVCSSADSNCPYIATAAKRILIPFEDPKDFDGTPEQIQKYAERSEQIATEFLYVFSMVSKDG